VINRKTERTEDVAILLTVLASAVNQMGMTATAATLALNGQDIAREISEKAEQFPYFGSLLDAVMAFSAIEFIPSSPEGLTDAD